MEEKDIEKLIELVIAGGELRGDAFHFSEQEKLLYISQKGVGGIDSIFGHNVLDRGRDRFLASHGLQGLFAKSRDAGRNGGDKDLQARTDRKVRDVASLEYDKVTLRKKGLKI